MSKLIARIVVGGGLATLGALIGGPAGAYAGWKGGGFLATGNPLHLIPGGGLLSDGADVLSSASDAMSGISDVAHTSSAFADDIGGGSISTSGGDDYWWKK